LIRFQAVSTRKIFFTLLSTLLVVAGCTPSKTSQGDLPNAAFLDGLYVTRPEVEAPLIAILKLQNPALLETAKRQNGQLVIDKRLLAAIQKEQDDTIADLQKISPKIRVLIRYKLVLNGLAIWAPADTFEKIKALPNVVMGEKSAPFARPHAEEADTKGLVGSKTSVNFIGADAAYAQNIHGEGMRVGIIDTGVDFTHKMFLGEGTEEAYKNVDPSKATPAFPNKKVVGGIDIVGSEYNSGSENYTKRVPVPDANPIDESGHGTHVAGSVAGLGDGVNTYDGVAPAASLYAIKVFGAKGSTSDEVVIAALEYAADPTGDLSFKEQLDVVNLSLGSGYGNPHIMYNHAIRNLVRGGTVVVAAAGNNGDKNYVVGAPGISDDAISVASVLDHTTQNTEFTAAEFSFNGGSLITETLEGAITKPLADVSAAQGEIIYLGFADTDFDSALKEQIKGKVAFIDRGKVAFADKIKRAQDSGAIAVIIANNAEGDSIVMGGDGSFDIPGVMITKKDADAVKAALQKGAVQVNLKPATKIEKPWLADTVSPFSSRGPRSEDGLIKPEISAPGSNIISAKVGGGENGVLNSGTSMASPHIAGVMALLKQKFKDLNAYELKSVLLSHGKVISDPQHSVYPVARQGAGRVQVAESLKAQIVTVPSTLSFGITDLEKQKTLRQNITVKNISGKALSLKAQWRGGKALRVSAPDITLAPGESKTLTVTAKLNATDMVQPTEELDGFLNLADDKDVLAHLPALAVVRKISQVSAKSLTAHSTSAADSAGSAVDLVLRNDGVNGGTAYLFNLLGRDERKKDDKPDLAHNRNCDLQSAGYRIIEKEGARVLQFGFKLYEGQTTWNTCEVNVQIDADGDGKTDQEIAGLVAEDVPGLSGEDFATVVLDGERARQLRQQFEKDIAVNPAAKENYTEALIDQRPMYVFDNATLAIIEADVSALAIANTGELNIKVSTTHQDAGAIEYDDYLNDQATAWKKISLNPQAQSFSQMPEEIELAGQETVTIPLLKGYGSEDLILFAPQNRGVRDTVLEDSQSQVIPVTYGGEE